MGTHVNGHRLIGNEQRFRGYKAYWDCHRDALFISSIQAHCTRASPRSPLASGIERSELFTQTPSHYFLTASLFYVHGFVRFHHQFAQRNGAFGIELRYSHGEG